MTTLPPASVLAEALGEEEAPAPTIEDRITGLTAQIGTLADLPDLALASPEERGRIAALRNRIAGVHRELGTWIEAIDHSFRVAAYRMGAKQLTTDDGVVRVEVARGEWKVRVSDLRAELEELVPHGLISAAELAEVFHTIVEERADNRRLNFLAANRGDEIKAAIERHRTWQEPPLSSARVRYDRQKEDR